MDPGSDRITMELGTWYGNLDSMIIAIRKSAMNSTTIARQQELAQSLADAAAHVRADVLVRMRLEKEQKADDQRRLMGSIG